MLLLLLSARLMMMMMMMLFCFLLPSLLPSLPFPSLPFPFFLPFFFPCSLFFPTPSITFGPPSSVFFVLFDSALFCFMLGFVYLSVCKRSKLTRKERKAFSQRPHFPLSQCLGLYSSLFSVLFVSVLFVSVLFLLTNLFATAQTRFNG